MIVGRGRRIARGRSAKWNSSGTQQTVVATENGTRSQQTVAATKNGSGTQQTDAATKTGSCTQQKHFCVNADA